MRKADCAKDAADESAELISVSINTAERNRMNDGHDPFPNSAGKTPAKSISGSTAENTVSISDPVICVK